MADQTTYREAAAMAAAAQSDLDAALDTHTATLSVADAALCAIARELAALRARPEPPTAATAARIC